MSQIQSETYTAFHLAEEQACGNYLEARRDMLAKGRRAASLAQLVAEQPYRVDYHDVWTRAVLTHQDAVQRTRLAYLGWQRAIQRTDTARPEVTFAGKAA